MATNQKSLSKPDDCKFSVYMTQDNVKALVETAIGKDAQRFTANIISAVSTNPALQACQNFTILSAALLGQSLGLSPSPQLGQFYMVPFEDKKNKRTVAQFVLGYKGFIQLAMRTGQYSDLDCIEVRDGEYKGRDKKTGKHLFEFIEDDDKRETLPIIGYMAYFELENGFRKTLYWSKQKMVNHADAFSPAFSKEATLKKTSYGMKQKVSFADYQAGKYDPADEWMYSSFWYKNFDDMAFKTMLRQLISKWGVMSIEMVSAFERDDAIINATVSDNGETSFVSDFTDVSDAEPAQSETAPAPTQEEKAEFDFFADTGDAQ